MSKYDKSFKEEAIRLAVSSNQAIAKTAYDLGIKESTLYAWVSAVKDKSPAISNEDGNSTNLIEELNRLRLMNPLIFDCQKNYTRKHAVLTIVETLSSNHLVL
ncbi:MAG: transposase [Gammaproteobacteria bacterium]